MTHEADSKIRFALGFECSILTRRDTCVDDDGVDTFEVPFLTINFVHMTNEDVARVAMEGVDPLTVSTADAHRYAIPIEAVPEFISYMMDTIANKGTPEIKQQFDQAMLAIIIGALAE